MSLIYDGGVVAERISLNRFVELTSTAAAKIFGLFPKKGTIAVGSDADIVIFDPDREQTISAKTHHMRVDYSAYEGRSVRGVTETVFRRRTGSRRERRVQRQSRSWPFPETRHLRLRLR